MTGSIPAGLATGVTQLGLVWGSTPKPVGLLDGDDDAGALIWDVWDLLPCLRLLAVYESLNWLMVESLEQILMQQQMDLLSYQ